MKRILVIAVLSVLLLASVGAGVVTAKQDVKPNLAGKQSIYFYNVASTDNSGSGLLVINLKDHKFLFIGKGFEPSQTYYLRYTIGDTPGIHTFASVNSTPSGFIVAKGTWIHDVTSFSARPTFSITPPVATGASLHAELHWATQAETIYQAGVAYNVAYFWAMGSTEAVGVGYTLITTISYGGGEQVQTVYDGPHVSLNANADIGSPPYSDPIYVRVGAQNSATLIVYDLLSGNSVECTVNDFIDLPSS